MRARSSVCLVCPYYFIHLNVLLSNNGVSLAIEAANKEYQQLEQELKETEEAEEKIRHQIEQINAEMESFKVSHAREMDQLNQKVSWLRG